MSLVVSAKTTFLSGLTCAPPIPTAASASTAAVTTTSERFMPTPLLTWRSVPNDELVDGHAGSELPDELVRIELDPDRVPVERGREHPRLAFLGRREVIDLELDAIAVRIAIVHRRRGTVVDAEERADALVLDAPVVVEVVAHRAERERDVVQARLIARLHHERGAGLGVAGRQRSEVEEGDAMMLLVVRHEGQVRVLVDHASPEHRAIPVTHLLDPVRLEHDVGELGRWHDRSS